MLCFAFSCIRGCKYKVSFWCVLVGPSRAFLKQHTRKKLVVLEKTLILKLLK